ncbi:hypothetical protein [Gaiella sp.]|jgi:hypothetical protein|uniref:hypothetical protein n=1 Tax=Gaiella sp. TaxID=2663207 RepID=UPI002E37A1F8|nr:hypothetical protein [Gaiella sp.]HEX5583622.1 hypothetical protein [Gaiella sp.]
MKQRCAQRLRDLIGADAPVDELERLMRVDASLRLAAAHDRRRRHARRTKAARRRSTDDGS